MLAENAPLFAASRKPASPASSPLSACACTTRFRMGMPDSSAAFPLAPVIRISRPSLLKRNSNPTTSAATSAIGTTKGMLGPQMSPVQ